ncbi:MAG: CBS domain-containing protein [Gemmatimonadetes bacterium]|nr:CBS domain-containing protein [Gemmatimonadota bacterium]MCH8308928.1 CBS domain-containing protein [Chloroflexota bacterium]
MKLAEILRNKGHEVITITESESVLDAARLLVEKNIGGLVVMDGARTLGILTERDILRLTARAPGELGSTEVGTVMTRAVITAQPEDELTDLMDLMTENRIRHLPVMEGDRLAGIVSIGDLLNACRIVAEDENSQLRQYIHGAG